MHNGVFNTLDQLIDFYEGVEYEAARIWTGANSYQLIPTGKKYEKRYGTCWLDRTYFAVTSVRNQEDTHGFICFGEPLEKVVEMPKILAGDLIVDRDEASYYVSEMYTNGTCKLFTGVCLNLPEIKTKEIWRNGVKIWKATP